jgi:TPR repeat protein
MIVLGSMYYDGEGTDSDAEEGCFWLRLSMTRKLGDADRAMATQFSATAFGGVPWALPRINRRISLWKPHERYREIEAEELKILLREAGEADARRMSK